MAIQYTIAGYDVRSKMILNLLAAQSGRTNEVTQGSAGSSSKTERTELTMEREIEREREILHVQNAGTSKENTKYAAFV